MAEGSKEIKMGENQEPEKQRKYECPKQHYLGNRRNAVEIVRHLKRMRKNRIPKIYWSIILRTGEDRERLEKTG